MTPTLLTRFAVTVVLVLLWWLSVSDPLSRIACECPRGGDVTGVIAYTLLGALLVTLTWKRNRPYKY